MLLPAFAGEVSGMVLDFRIECLQTGKKFLSIGGEIVRFFAEQFQQDGVVQSD